MDSAWRLIASTRAWRGGVNSRRVPASATIVVHPGRYRPSDVRAPSRHEQGCNRIMRSILLRMRSCARRMCAQPLGYLAFLIAAWALAICSRLLGRGDPLGSFAGRLSDALGRHPDITRPGIRVAWLAWAVLLVLACSPLDPMATWWDELVLAAVAIGCVWHRIFSRPHRTA